MFRAVRALAKNRSVVTMLVEKKTLVTVTTTTGTEILVIIVGNLVVTVETEEVVQVHITEVDAAISGHPKVKLQDYHYWHMHMIELWLWVFVF